MILCVGPVGSGKTTLLKQLADSANAEEELPATVPTMGTNILHVLLDKKRRVRVHELGGAMSAIWCRHFVDCRAVVYVVDARNLQQVSCASIRLMEIVTDPLLQQCPILVVLNKLDLESTTSVLEIRSVLFLNDICSKAKQSVTIVETSCATGQGLDRVRAWLARLPALEGS